jgi:O-antigen/teichoic acid export membrane protein
MSQTTRNILANYAGQAWSAVAGLAFIPVYVRYLGIEAYGLIGLFAVIQAWLSLLDMGMTPALSREMARFTAGAYTAQSIRDLLRSVEVICFSVATLIGVGIWMASDFLASDWLQSEQLPEDVLAHALGIMGLVVALRFCEGIYRASLLGLQRQILYNVANAVLATARHGGAAAVLAWVSPSIQAFFLWQAAISIVTVVVFARSVHRTLPSTAPIARFSWEALGLIWRFASGVTAITFLALLLTQVDKVLLSRLLPLQLFGYYTLAATLAGVLYMFIAPITQAVYPRMVQLSAPEDEAKLAAVYHQSSQFVTVLTAPVVSLLALFSEGVLFTWSGDANLAAHTAPILVPLVLGTFLNGLMWMPYHCQLAHGWTSLTLKINTVAVVLLVPAFFWVIPKYGAAGAAWAWVALNAGYVLVAIQLMHRKLMQHEKWRWYLADIISPFAAAVLVTLLVKVVHPMNYQNRVTSLAVLTLTGTLGAAASILAAGSLRARCLALFPGAQPSRNSRAQSS